MALNLESINNALLKACGRTINLEEKAFETDDVSDNKFDGVEDDFCIFTGNESRPLRLMISKIREQEGFTPGSDKMIEDMIARAAKPGGGLHFYEKGEGKRPKYTPKIVSVEEYDLGQVIASQSNVEQYKALTPPPVGELYQRNRFNLFFKKLFKGKSEKAELERKYKMYQSNKASYDASLRTTDAAVKSGKKLRETNGLKEKEKARFNEMLPDVKKEKAIAEKINKAAFERHEKERKEREKEEAKDNIDTIASDKPYKTFKNDKFLSSAAASKKLGINEPKLDIKIEDYKAELLEAFGPEQTDRVITILNKSMHALRFGCVMQELLTEGTALNKAIGKNALHLPLSLINADMGNKVDDEVKQVMGEVCKVAAEKSDEIIKTFIADSKKGNTLITNVLNCAMNTGNAILKGMPPEEIKNNPAQFMETANLLNRSLECLFIPCSFTLQNDPLYSVFGFGEIAAIAERAESSKADNCRKLKAANEKEDGDEQHFNDCTIAFAEINSGYSAPQLLQEYYAKSQQIQIEGNEECKQIMKNAQVQEKSIKNLAITIGNLSANLPFKKEIANFGMHAVQKGIASMQNSQKHAILHEYKNNPVKNDEQQPDPNTKKNYFNEYFLEDVIENKQQLVDGIDKLANKKHTLATDKCSIADTLRAGLEKQAAAIKEAQEKSKEKAIPQINIPDANKENAKNNDIAK